MSLKPIPNNIIEEIERLISTGATYKEIKEKFKVSDGTIAKIKQGKITSARVLTPVCENREEELSVLYNSKKDECKSLRKYIFEQQDQITKLNNELRKTEKEKNFFEEEYYKYKKLYEDKEYYYNQLKNDFKALKDSQHNISPVKSKESLKNAPVEHKVNLFDEEDTKMNSFDAGIKIPNFFED